MIHCDEALELISASLDGELTAEEQLLLDDHLAACQDCQALLDDFTKIHTTLSGLNAPAPADLSARVMAHIAEEKVVPLVHPANQKRRWKRWTATAAVFAVILLGAHTLGEQNAVAPAELAGQSAPVHESVEDSTIGRAAMASPETKRDTTPKGIAPSPTLGDEGASITPERTEAGHYNHWSAVPSRDPSKGTSAPRSTPAASTPQSFLGVDPASDTPSPNVFSQPEARTMEESLDVLLSYLGWSDYTLDADGSTILGEADANGTIPALTYLSLSENEEYYIFALHQRTGDTAAPFSDAVQTTLTSCYALPLDGGDIVQGVGSSFYDALHS